MKTKHTTKEGEVMLIAQMDNEHLMNTINVHICRIADVKAMIDQEDEDPLAKQLYGVQGLTTEQAAEAINMIVAKLKSYIFEAYLRGLHSASNRLATALGRYEALPKYMNRAQFTGLPERVEGEIID